LIFAGVIFIMLAGCVVWLQLRKEASLDNDDYWHQPEVMKL
jgi:hypothetical protein